MPCLARSRSEYFFSLLFRTDLASRHGGRRAGDRIGLPHAAQAVVHGRRGMRRIGHHAGHAEGVNDRGTTARRRVAVERGVVAGEHGVEGVRTAEANADEHAKALGIVWLCGNSSVCHGLLRGDHGKLRGAIKPCALPTEQVLRICGGGRHQQIGQASAQCLGHPANGAAGRAGRLETRRAIRPQWREHAHASDQHRTHWGPTAEPCTSMCGNSPL